MKWNLKELRRFVERLFGENQLHTVNQCLRTLEDRRSFSRYHFNEAKDRMDEVLQGCEEDELTATLLGAHDTGERQFSTARFKAYAHTVACVQSMHAVVDNMIHFSYYVLGANLNPSTRIESERGITWPKVRSRLDDGPIKEGLCALVEDPSFTYLAALNNHSKHRSMVEVSYAVNFQSQDVKHGLTFSGFTYDGVAYEARWVRPILISEYQRQEGLILAIGNAVNKELRSRL